MPAKSWLYHRVPECMIGNTLYPLNELRSIHPSAAVAEREKYSSRENLMTVRLPILNCLWNDVIHLSPVNPRLIKKALAQAGALPADLPKRWFFVINPMELEEGRAIHFKNSIDTEGKYTFQEGDFSVFSAEWYEELEDLPPAQHEYNKRMLNEGGRPLLYARTPHVFYRGSINVSGLSQIEW